MHADVRSWYEKLAALCEDPQQTPQKFNSLRATYFLLLAEHGDACDRAVAQLWQIATPVSRATLLAPLCDGAAPGAELTRAAVASVAQGDARSANAGLRVLGEGATLVAEQWCELGKVASAQRAQTLPDVEATAFLARHGPAEALPTVTLAAFRHGPEDADDRLLAVAALGRFADPRVVNWLRALVRSGCAHLEVIQAAAQLMDRDSAAAADLLEAVATADHGLDATARWAAVQGLAYLRGAEALPQVLAAWRAGGDDLPGDYLSGLLSLAIHLEPSLAKSGEAALRKAAAAMAAPMWPPVPGLVERVASRDARVARQAAALVEPTHPALLQRAAVEAALVARKQLLGTLLPTAPASELGPGWQPSAQRLSNAERRQLEQEEAAWLAT